MENSSISDKEKQKNQQENEGKNKSYNIEKNIDNNLINKTEDNNFNNLKNKTEQNSNNNKNFINNNYIKKSDLFQNQFKYWNNYYFYNNCSSIYYGNKKKSYYYSNYVPQSNKFNFSSSYPQNLYTKVNNGNYEEDKEIAKSSMKLIQSQSGCRFLIEKSLSNKIFANELLFPEIKNNLKEICCNILGSSLMKNLIDILFYENLNLFIDLTKNFLFEIGLTEPGSRVIQKLIERIYQFPLLLDKFIFNLNSKDIMILIVSQYGNYIIRKYLEVVKKDEYSDFLYNYIYNHFIDIIKEKYGVCVIIRALNESNESQRKTIFKYILNNFEIIMKNNYGNFIIQHLLLNLKIKNFEEILPIIIKIEEKIVDYCTCQNSSIVMEKCFEKAQQKISEHMIKYLVENHLNSLLDIVQNDFGFYIIKKALKIQNNDLKEKIIKYIINNRDKLKESNDKNNIIEKLGFDTKDLYDKFCKK